MKQFLLILSIATVVNSCAQTRLPVVKSYGFFRQNSRGTMRVDEKNNPTTSAIDSQYQVYIEIAAAIHPVFTKACVNDQTYNVSVTKIRSPFIVGVQKNNGDTIVLSAQTGSDLWQLNLQKGKNEDIPAHYSSSTTPHNIVAIARINKKEVLLVVPTILELSPIIFQ